MRGPTIAMLAKTAGVSVATVDRVLTGRLPVRAETARKVHEAARRIGFRGANAIHNRIFENLPQLRVGIVLQKPNHEFYQKFAQQIRDELSEPTSHRFHIDIKFANSTLPAELAELLRSFSKNTDIVAATGVDHHDVTQAVTELKKAGIPTISLLSDFAQGERACYLGVNNMRVGRAIGWLFSQMMQEQGKIALFVGGHRFHGHELRETGFRSALREFGPQFEVLNSQINLETRQLTHEATLELCEKHSDLKGVYCVGGGMEGAISAVSELSLTRKIRLAVSELTDASLNGLRQHQVDVVCCTPLEQLCAELKQILTQFKTNGEFEIPGQKFLPFSLVTPEMF